MLLLDPGTILPADRPAWALADFPDRRGYWRDQVAVQHRALAAGRRMGDPGIQARAYRWLAIVSTAHAPTGVRTR